MLEKLVLRLIREAPLQILVQHLHDLNDNILLILVNLRCYRLCWPILLVLFLLPLFEAFLIKVLLVIHLVLHQVVYRDQLINFEVLFSMAHLRVLALCVISPRIDEVTEVCDGYTGLHGCVEVVNGVQAQVVSARIALILLFILIILTVHLEH